MGVETFADYILSEKDWIKKMEIVYYLQKRTGIFYDNSVVFKTLLTKLFIDRVDLQVDKNIVITASLLWSCKKNLVPKDLSKIHSFAKEGAEYLAKLGFDERFCRICEGVNRYSGLTQREPESDLLELFDQFGGMLIDRPERIGFAPDEALVFLEHRNLKSEYNRYLEIFKNFVEHMEKIEIQGAVNTTVFARLQKLIRDSKNIPDFVKSLANEYSPNVDEKIEELTKQKITDKDKNRPMFTAEIEERILKHVKCDN